jgi:hypothetical protein
MKYLRPTLFVLLFMNITLEIQATEYIIIHERFLGSYRLIYVDKPKNLKKWYYDKESDTYYRAKNAFGIPFKITSKILPK